MKRETINLLNCMEMENFEKQNNLIECHCHEFFISDKISETKKKRKNNINFVILLFNLAPYFQFMSPGHVFVSTSWIGPVRNKAHFVFVFIFLFPRFIGYWILYAIKCKKKRWSKIYIYVYKLQTTTNILGKKTNYLIFIFFFSKENGVNKTAMMESAIGSLSFVRLGYFPRQ